MIRTKTTAWLNALALSAALCGAAPSSAAPVVAITLPATTFDIDVTFMVDIDITGASGVYGHQFDLGFDPRVLRAESSAEGTWLAAAGTTVFFGGDIDNDDGVVEFVAGSLVGPAASAGGAGALAHVTFTALAAGATDLVLSNVLLIDAGLTPIATTIGAPARLVVKPATPPPIPEPASMALLLMGLGVLASLRSRPRA
jgi:Cohesin domain/PEP-CTERM motif